MPAPITAVAAHGTSFALADSAATLVRSESHRPVADVGARRHAARVRARRDAGHRVARRHDSDLARRRARRCIVRQCGRTGRGDLGRRPAASLVERRRRAGARLRARRHACCARSARMRSARRLAPDGTRRRDGAGARGRPLGRRRPGKLLHRLVGHRRSSPTSSSRPTAARVVTASDDHDARIWDVADGRLAARCCAATSSRSGPPRSARAAAGS